MPAASAVRRSRRVVGEERAEVQLADLLVVGLERLPRSARGQWQHRRHRRLPSCLRAQPALSRTALLEAITSMSSRQEETKDLAPSSWSWAARAFASIPPAAKRANTSSL